MKKLFILLPQIFLVSCGTYYKNPQEQPGRTATIQSNNKRSGLFDWSNFTVESIDNLPVNYSTALVNRVKKIVVTEGTHNVVLDGSFNQSLGGGGPYQARTDVDMNFIGGHSYIANGIRKGSKLKMWIEDAQTGKVASPVMEIPYQNIPQSYSYPIFIPAS